MKPLHEWADLVYLPYGSMAHILPWVRTSEWALCHFVTPRFGQSWRGTGSQDEYDKAKSLPLCERCRQVTEKESMGG